MGKDLIHSEILEKIRFTEEILAKIRFAKTLNSVMQTF
jgi:hypothetical protein